MAIYLQRNIIGIEMIKLSNSYSSYLRVDEKVIGDKSVMDYCFNSTPLSSPKAKSEIAELYASGWTDCSFEDYEALRLQVVERFVGIKEMISS